MAYANAQTRSVIGVAALEGTAPRTLTLSTWNNSGELYVQVRGNNGAFTPLAPFQVQATVLDGQCPNVQVLPGIDAQALEPIVALSAICTYQRGEVIFEEQGRGRAWYIVREGRVEIVVDPATLGVRTVIPQQPQLNRSA